MSGRVRGVVTVAVLVLAMAACRGDAPPQSRAPTPDSRLPYPIPGSCPQTHAYMPTELPELLTEHTEYWIGATDIFAGHVSGPAWHSGANEVVWFSRDGQPQVSMRLIEGRKRPDATIVFGTAQPPLYRATMRIPLAGCWEVSATTPNHRLIFIVFAYPERVVP